MFKATFSGHKTIRGSQKVGGTAPECPRGFGPDSLFERYEIEEVFSRVRSSIAINAAQYNRNRMSQALFTFGDFL